MLKTTLYSMKTQSQSSLEWLKDHSHPYVDVNVPGDLEFCEFVYSEGYSLRRYREEARERGVSLEGYIKGKFREWQNDGHRR